MFNPGDKLLNDERYEIIQEVGRGGMGIVFKAHDINLDRSVAIKILPPEIASDRRAIRNLKNEAKTAAGLLHENVVAVYDLAEWKIHNFIIMEFVEGQTLFDVLYDEFPIPIERVLDIVIQICTGLQYIHERQVLHRDIKPHNIMLLTSGLVKITDFGIAHIVKQTVTQLTGRTTGTMPYLAPELFAAKKADARSDIYALGVTLYEILTNDLPFPGPDFAFQHLQVEVESPSERKPELNIPSGLSAIVMKCLEKNPDDRYSSMHELRTSLLTLREYLLNGNKLPELIKQAHSYYQTGKYQNALIVWQKILEVDPTNEEARAGMAQVQVCLNKEIEIQALFEQAQDASQAEDYEKVIKLCQQVLDIDPNNMAARSGMEAASKSSKERERDTKIKELIGQAQVEQRAGNLRGELDIWKKVLEVAPENPLAKSRLPTLEELLAKDEKQAKIQALFQQSQDETKAEHYDQVIALCQQVLELDPTNEAAKFGIENVQKILAEQKKERERLIRQAQDEERNGSFQKAIQSWKQILDTDPTNPTAKTGLQNAEKAYADQQLKERDSVIRQAQAEQKAGRLEETVQLWQKVVRMDPHHSSAKKELDAAEKLLNQQREEVKYLVAQAKKEEEKGNLEAANQTWKKVLQLEPNNSVAQSSIEVNRQILDKEKKWEKDRRKQEEQRRRQEEEWQRQEEVRKKKERDQLQALINQAQDEERAGSANALQTWQRALQLAPDNKLALSGVNRSQELVRQQSHKKIDYAVAASAIFIDHLHRDGFDRGMIATFGNSFRVEQGFTSNERALQSALVRVSNSITDERTRLYDSIEDVIGEFWRYGERNRPWLLTIITDGQDNESRKYVPNDWRSPGRIGDYIAQRFNHERTNFSFLIGVGEGQQINSDALVTIGDRGHFPAVTIAAFPALEILFLEIALRVSNQLVGRRVTVGNMSWEEVAQVRQLSHTPIDYAFLIDRSGSMGEPGGDLK